MLLAADLQNTVAFSRGKGRLGGSSVAPGASDGGDLAFDDLQKRKDTGGLPENVTRTSELLDAQLQALKIEVEDMLRSDRELMSVQRERELLAESSAVVAASAAHVSSYAQQADLYRETKHNSARKHKPARAPPKSPYFTMETQEKPLASSFIGKGDHQRRSPWRSPSRTSARSHLHDSRFGKHASLTGRSTLHTSAAHSTGTKKGIVRRLKAALHTEQALRFSADASIRELQRENEVLKRQIDVLHKYEDKYNLVKKEYAHLKQSFERSERLRLEQKRVIENASLMHA
jgi:hypothetical protein